MLDSLDGNFENLGVGLDDDLKQAVLLYLGIILLVLTFFTESSVEKHFYTFDATHGTPLPVELVHSPWQL